MENTNYRYITTRILVLTIYWLGGVFFGFVSGIYSSIKEEMATYASIILIFLLISTFFSMCTLHSQTKQHICYRDSLCCFLNDYYLYIIFIYHRFINRLLPMKIYVLVTLIAIILREPITELELFI